MNTSNRAIRAAAKAKTMRLNRWNKVPHNRSAFTFDKPPRRMSARKARAIHAAGEKDGWIEFEATHELPNAA